MSSTRHEALEQAVKRKEKAVEAFCIQVDHLVLKDETEVAKRLKRRMHIHVCLFIATSLLTFASVISLVSMSYVVGAQLCFQYIQEYVDYVGGF